MEVQLIGQKFFENLNQFEKTTIKSRWDRVAMVTEGSYTFYPDNGTKTQTICKNEIAFFPASTTITRTLSAPLTYYHVSFATQAEDPFRLALPSGKLTLPEEQTTAIFNSMKEAFLMPNNQELIEHVIERIFVENYLFGEKKQISNRPLSDEVLRAIRYMNAHLQEKIDMDLLADHVYLSHTGLIWKFRQELNTTPQKYLTMLRMRYAKQLLLDHDYTVTEIAELCGYSNPFYFTNAFHQHEGQSPTEFRKSYLERLEKNLL